tara:strand:- start:3023 stop:3292 length:270 start_codon:yes stop_codon:yes gene_type:complete
MGLMWIVGPVLLFITLYAFGHLLAFFIELFPQPQNSHMYLCNDTVESFEVIAGNIKSKGTTKNRYAKRSHQAVDSFNDISIMWADLGND